MTTNEAGQGMSGGRRWWVGLLLVVSVVLYVAGFVHLRADFPNGSPWKDWSKMTDEGWYGGAAAHHYVVGHWYLPDSFNPAVALPVWPVMLGLWFAVTGMGMEPARALTMLLYGLSLVLLYRVVSKALPGTAWAAVAVLLTVLNPFCYAFDRLALLEPLTVFWLMLALWLASGTKRGDWWRVGALGMVLVLLILTKVTGLALAPAVLYLVWAGWGGTKRGVAPVAAVMGIAGVLWVAYLRLAVRPHYLADYKLLFSLNAYRVHLSIVPNVAVWTLWDGLWIQPILFPLAMLVLVVATMWLRELWRKPLFVAAALAIFGHLAYVGYHTNFQPRYYLVIAMPMMIVIVMGGAAVWARRKVWERVAMEAALTVAAGMMAVTTWGYVTRPAYSFLEAAQSIAAVVTADGGGKPLLSDSGDDITLMTGMPTIAACCTPNGADALYARYQPEWYAAWPEAEGLEIGKVKERYRLNEVARYRVFDDPTRQTLVLYKLTPR